MHYSQEARDTVAEKLLEGLLDEGQAAVPKGNPSTNTTRKKDRSLFSKLLMAVVIVGVMLGLGVLVAVGLLYGAATASVPEYERLLVELEQRQETGELDRERQELESQVAALYSDARSLPRWKAVISEDQINGWLTVQLPIDFPQFDQEKGIQQPRFLLHDESATLACRATVRGVQSVATLTIAPVVAEEGWAGIEFQSVMVGRLPLPLTSLKQLVDKAVEVAGRDAETFRYRWTENNGNPVMLLNVEQIASTPEQARRIDTLQVRDGQLYIGGTSEARTESRFGARGEDASGKALDRPE